VEYFIFIMNTHTLEVKSLTGKLSSIVVKSSIPINGY